MVAPAASADPESDAKDLFARGRELRNAQDCGSAAPLFRKAWTIYPSGLGSLRNLAECEEQLGHFASARRAWLDLKRALVTAPQDPKYEDWDKDAEEAAARLKFKVASFVVDVYVRTQEGESLADDQSGVEVFVNGESVGTTLVGTPLERDPGVYRIRAQRADAEPVEQKVTLSAGDNPHVTIRLTAKPAMRAVATETGTGSGRRTAGYIVAGVGAASLIGAGVTFILRQSALAELEEGCPRYEEQPCPSRLRGTVDSGQLMSTLSPIFLGVGLAGVGAGVTLILTAPSKKEVKTTKLPTISAGLGRVDATWRF
ncbi:MAG TPA: tetratricopeptide repeat protein [Labilithrix sp.]|nr:tetratricopeptide repeat protein [Labilithrix sp.]